MNTPFRLIESKLVMHGRVWNQHRSRNEIQGRFIYGVQVDPGVELREINLWNPGRFK